MCDNILSENNAKRFNKNSQKEEADGGKPAWFQVNFRKSGSNCKDFWSLEIMIKKKKKKKKTRTNTTNTHSG